MTHSSGYKRKTYHSPPSSENRRSLFVEFAKRGKQRVGGEAFIIILSLFLLHFSIQLRNLRNVKSAML